MIASPPNSSFSSILPTLQLGLDSTSLGAFKKCPRYYQLAIVDGWEPQDQSVHLTFGIILHEAREEYEHQRTQGTPHQEALTQVVRSALQKTWDPQRNRPWDSGHPAKNRLTLVRSIVWYLDSTAQHDPAETLILANGRPAVELSFRFASGYSSPATGEPILLCGHMDRIASLNGDNYIVDIKTTGSGLSQKFFDLFTPGNQVSLYSLAAQIALSIPVKGLIIDGLQITPGFTKTLRGLIGRTQAQLEQWHLELRWWINSMAECAETGLWPQNEASCGYYGGCQFRRVCSRPSPSGQALELKTGFAKRVWDPLQARGDF